MLVHHVATPSARGSFGSSCFGSADIYFTKLKNETLRAGEHHLRQLITGAPAHPARSQELGTRNPVPAALKQRCQAQKLTKAMFSNQSPDSPDSAWLKNKSKPPRSSSFSWHWRPVQQNASMNDGRRAAPSDGHCDLGALLDKKTPRLPAAYQSLQRPAEAAQGCDEAQQP